MNFNEQEFKKAIRPHMLHCRPGDLEHNERAAQWVKKLGEGREDLHLIVTAAYIHDIGWRDVLSKDKIEFDELLKYEHQANKNSEQYAREVLGTQGYSDEETKTILRLIRASDNHRSEQDDEEIMVDADNLSQLTIDHLKEKYQESEWRRMLEHWETEVPIRIRTKMGHELYPGLLKRLEKELEEYK